MKETLCDPKAIFVGETVDLPIYARTVQLHSNYKMELCIERNFLANLLLCVVQRLQPELKLRLRRKNPILGACTYSVVVYYVHLESCKSNYGMLDKHTNI